MNVKPPTYLSRRGKSIFKEVLAMLTEDSEKPIDLHLIGTYADNAATYEELARLLRKNGLTYTDKNKQVRKRPETMLQAKAFDQMTRAAAALGLDRRTRIRLAAGKAPTTEKPQGRLTALRKRAV